MGADGESPRALAVLPARLGSTRLPAKVLLAETGRPLFVHTAEAVGRAARVQRVLIATDDEGVLLAAQTHGLDATMTSASHQSGTDRVNEAAEAAISSGGPWDVILNVQADEPEVEAVELDALVDAFTDPAIEVATLAAPIDNEADLAATSVVKVVRNSVGDALYFSRSPLPNSAHARSESGASGTVSLKPLRHVGVYAFRPEALADFCALPLGTLERTENLEQLRWLEAGRRIRVLDAGRAHRGIDTEADYQAFVTRMNESSTEAKR